MSELSAGLQETKLGSGSTVHVIIWYTVSTVIDKLDRLQEVLWNNIPLECKVSHCHDNIGRGDVPRAAVCTGVTGSTKPEIRVSQGFILKPKDTASHKEPDPV